MAIIVETGAIVTGANSYVSEAELSTYATNRGITITGNTEQLLHKSMDFLEGKCFIGGKIEQDQPLQWPRTGAYIDGFYTRTDTIPELLKEAQIEIALAYDGGSDPLAIQDRETRRERVGELEVEYTPQARANTYLAKAEWKLKKLVETIVRVHRA